MGNEVRIKQGNYLMHIHCDKVAAVIAAYDNVIPPTDRDIICEFYTIGDDFTEWKGSFYIAGNHELIKDVGEIAEQITNGTFWWDAPSDWDFGPEYYDEED